MYFEKIAKISSIWKKLQSFQVLEKIAKISSFWKKFAKFYSFGYFFLLYLIYLKKYTYVQIFKLSSNCILNDIILKQ